MGRRRGRPRKTNRTSPPPPPESGGGGEEVETAEKEEEEEEEVEDDDKLKEIYLNKNFEAPMPKELETIFEASEPAHRRAAQSSSSSLIIGQHKARRMIPPATYWVEDEAVTRKRKKMIRKHFKGSRKPLKLTPLSPNSKDILLNLIEKSEEDLEEEDHHPPLTPLPLTPDFGLKGLEPSPSFERQIAEADASLGSITDTFETPPILKGSPRKAAKRRQRRISLDRTPLKEILLHENFNKLSNSPEDSENKENIRSLDDLKKPSTSTEKSQAVIRPDNEKEAWSSLEKQIAEADASLGDIMDTFDISTTTKKKKKTTKSDNKNKKEKRESIRMVVRRSSRLVRNNYFESSSESPLCGSIYAEAEVYVKSRRRSIRIQQDLKVVGKE